LKRLGAGNDPDEDATRPRTAADPARQAQERVVNRDRFEISLVKEPIRVVA
jgi:hypothetical protein